MDWHCLQTHTAREATAAHRPKTPARNEQLARPAWGKDARPRGRAHAHVQGCSRGRRARAPVGGGQVVVQRGGGRGQRRVPQPQDLGVEVPLRPCRPPPAHPLHLSHRSPAAPPTPPSCPRRNCRAGGCIYWVFTGCSIRDSRSFLVPGCSGLGLWRRQVITGVQAVHGLVELQLLATVQFCGRRAVLQPQAVRVGEAAVVLSIHARR